MVIKQLATIVNGMTTQVLGSTALVSEDLSNVVDIGKTVFNVTDAQNKIISGLIDHIGRVIFVDRAYTGSAPSVLMDSWEYGSIMQKIQSEMPIATDNPSWSLTDGVSYDPHIYHAASAESKFFNQLDTFQIERSIPDHQLKESFSSAGQLNAFVSMLYNEVQKALTVRTDALIMRTINNMIAETVSSTSARAINLLAGYNAQFGESLTVANALTTPAFIRYSAYIMGLYVDRLSKISTLFNDGAKARFTPRDRLHIVTLSEFQAAANVYLQSDTYHNEYTKLQNAESVPYWQGSGTDYSFSSTSTINVTTVSGKPVNQSGILSVMFDRDALGVANQNRRVTTQWNAAAEFTNYWYKQEARYFNDFNENCIVFYIA